MKRSLGTDVYVMNWYLRTRHAERVSPVGELRGLWGREPESVSSHGGAIASSELERNETEKPIA